MLRLVVNLIVVTVAVGAVIFKPDSIEDVAGNHYGQCLPAANTSASVVSNGYLEQPLNQFLPGSPSSLDGWDPSGGAIYFYNPAKSMQNEYWTREVILKISDHVFAR